MKRFTKLFLALALLSTPVTFTSCDSSYYEEYGVSLVDNAINDFIASRLSRDYRTAYNWFCIIIQKLLIMSSINL